MSLCWRIHGIHLFIFGRWRTDEAVVAFIGLAGNGIGSLLISRMLPNFESRASFTRVTFSLALSLSSESKSVPISRLLIEIIANKWELARIAFVEEEKVSPHSISFTFRRWVALARGLAAYGEAEK